MNVFITAETGAGSPPALYKLEADRFAEYRRELALLTAQGIWHRSCLEAMTWRKIDLETQR